jgi:fatty acid desaturase
MRERMNGPDLPYSRLTRVVTGYIHSMIILGIIVAVVGFLLGIGILWVLGIVLIVIGLILLLLGTAGHAVGGRRHYF